MKVLTLSTLLAILVASPATGASNPPPTARPTKIRPAIGRSTSSRVHYRPLVRLEAAAKQAQFIRQARLAHRRRVEHRKRQARLRALQAVQSSASTWASSPFAVRVANCESGGGAGDPSTTYDGNPHVDNGHEGKWQFTASTYASVGGVGDAAYASESEQDYRAWLLWKRDGWSPWECAGLV